MNQESTLMDEHQSAMNTLMSKYSTKLMSTESAKRAKEMLEDNVGMELLNAGLSSGRLGSLGGHLAGKVLGRQALANAGDLTDAVNAFTAKGHAGVVEHFATKGKPFLARTLAKILPNGVGERLKAHIRATYGSAQEAAGDMGAATVRGIRDDFNARQAAALDSAGPVIDRYGNAVEPTKPRPIIPVPPSANPDPTTTALRKTSAQRAELTRKRAAERLARAKPVAGRLKAALAGPVQPPPDDVPRVVAPAEKPAVIDRVDDSFSVNKDKPLSVREKANAWKAAQVAKIKARFPDSLGQKANQAVAAAAAPVAVAEQAVAAPQRLVEEGGAPPPARQRAARRSRMRYNTAVESIRRTPAALRAALTRATKVRASGDALGFLGSEEEAGMQEALNRKSAKAGVLAHAAELRAQAEASFNKQARAERPENVLAPKRPRKLPYVPQFKPKRAPVFAEEPDEGAFGAVRGGGEE